MPKKQKWEDWINNQKTMEKNFTRFLKLGIIRQGTSENEAKGHLTKAKRNLLFSYQITNKLGGFFEWAIISYYYAVYQAALALCAIKGFKTKSHLATICILIKYFFPKHITSSDLKKLSEKKLLKEDLQEFVELKAYRENATYSISLEYEKRLTSFLGRNAIDFVNKTENIIETEKNAIKTK